VVGEPKKYVFRKYSEKFPALFAYEKRRLHKILPTALIEHFGSSAVPGLGGKGIIDVMVSVLKRSMDGALKKLIAHGYEYTGTGGGKDRKFLQRTIRWAGCERWVHVHLTPDGSRVWRRAIAVRDYLRRNKVVAMEYAKLKRLAAKEAKGDGAKYRRLKKDFLDRVKRRVLR
jgi:GrpB-like predicted nucleotidyltransferase (UPF0157 family)